jgi:hypothetical protein
LDTPSTSTEAAKNVASTNSATPGLNKASPPKATMAMPPTRKTHQARRTRACASAPRFSKTPLEYAIVFSRALPGTV